jgi:hypothetical protein
MTEGKLEKLIDAVENERKKLIDAIKRYHGAEIETQPEWKKTMQDLDKIENNLFEAAIAARGGRAKWTPLQKPPIPPEPAQKVSRRGKR